MDWNFYLDNDVDIGCARVFRDAGHVVWWTAQTGGQDASDDDQTVYAMRKDAVIVTHDRKFTNRRKAMPIGRHVRLVCHQLDAEDLLERAMDQLTEFLRASTDIVVEVAPGRGDLVNITATFGTEGR